MVFLGWLLHRRRRRNRNVAEVGTMEFPSERSFPGRYVRKGYHDAGGQRAEATQESGEKGRDHGHPEALSEDVGGR